MYPVFVVVMSLIAVFAAGWVMWKTKMAVPYACAISITKDIGEVQLGGGNIAYVKQVNSDGSPLASPDTWHTLPNLIDSKVPVDKEGTKVTTFEDGAKTENRSNRDVAGEFTFGQASKAVLDFKEETKGKFYQLYYQDAPMANGKVKEFVFAICQIFMDIENDHKAETEVQPKCRVRVTKNAATINVANVDLPSVKKTAAAMNVNAGAYYSIAET